MARNQVVVAARGGGIVFVGKLFAWGTRFVLAVILARLLGAEDYGLYNLALTTATVAASFPTLGLDAAVVRYTAIFSGRRDPGSVMGTLQLGIGVPAVLSLVVAAGFFLLADTIATEILNQPRLTPMLAIVSLLIPAMVLNRQLAGSLQGFKRIELAVLAEQFAQPFVRFALIGAFALLGLTVVHAVVASTVAALAVTAILTLLLVRLLPAATRATPPTRHAGEMARFSLPIFFSNVVTTVGSNLQTLFLGALATAASVGIFSVASHLNMVGSIFQQAVVAASMPLFAESHDRGDRRSLEHLYQTTSKWSLSLNLPFFVLVVAFPEGLLAVFGPEFVAGASALVILAWANLVNAATGTSGAVLDMTGHTKVKLLNSTVAVVLGLGLNILLIPAFGLIGAAVAALAGLASVNILRLVEVWWLVRVSPYNRSYVKPLLAGALGFVASVMAGGAVAAAGPIAEIAIGGVVLFAVYAAVLWALRLSDEDRLVLNRVRDKLLRRGKRSSTAADGHAVRTDGGRSAAERGNT